MARKAQILNADHRLHLRCELSDATTLEMFGALVDDPLVKLVSLMDHTPGQRQWTDLNKYRQYHRDKKWTDEEFTENIATRRGLQQTYATATRRQVQSACRERNIPIASHDDTTPAHVDQAAKAGITISEFPTTFEAASNARAAGMKIIAGAPNIVRGNSHSGNVSALQLGQHGLLDGLSSDYVPISLLHAAFVLHQSLALPLPAAVATVSANVADILNFQDRGSIEVDKRADLIQVHPVDGIPVARAVWRAGCRVN
jgi:alpha-D-ribose 1-methylphosphonate 5-triphosphate diphosphatase